MEPTVEVQIFPEKWIDEGKVSVILGTYQCAAQMFFFQFKYDENNIIGGCYDTTVYRYGQTWKLIIIAICSGMLPDDREVAVKRVMKKGAKSLQMVDREIDALKKSDSHDNVLRYYLMVIRRTINYFISPLAPLSKNAKFGIFTFFFRCFYYSLFFLQFEDARFHYLVLEFCQGSLHDLIEKKVP